MYEDLNECPLCTNTSLNHHLKVRDYLVSLEQFNLVKCSNCSFIFTNPRPSLEEISGFYQSEDYISHSDKKNSLMDQLYFLARNLMFHQKLKWLKKYAQKSEPLLDFGCGTGSFIQFLSKRNWDAWGVEPGDSARQIAIQSNPNRVFKSMDHMSVQSFGTITLWHVLEHLHRLNHDLDKIQRALKPDGRLLIAVPNCNSLDASYYDRHWAGYDVPRHLFHFTPETINKLASDHGMQVVKIFPLILDAYYISLLSEKHRKGFLLNAIYQGFRSNFYARNHGMNYSSLVYLLKNE